MRDPERQTTRLPEAENDVVHASLSARSNMMPSPSEPTPSRIPISGGGQPISGLAMEGFGIVVSLVREGDGAVAMFGEAEGGAKIVLMVDLPVGENPRGAQAVHIFTVPGRGLIAGKDTARAFVEGMAKTLAGFRLSALDSKVHLRPLRSKNP